MDTNLCACSNVAKNGDGTPNGYLRFFSRLT